jgi:hypothetical protein
VNQVYDLYADDYMKPLDYDLQAALNVNQKPNGIVFDVSVINLDNVAFKSWTCNTSDELKKLLFTIGYEEFVGNGGKVQINIECKKE